MASSDTVIQLIIKAVDLATEDLDSINAKVKELGASLGKSEFTRSAEGMTALGEAVKNATDPLAQATAKTLALQTALTGLAAMLANKAYQSAKDYESALADLAKVIDGGMDAAKGYGARLNETASQFARNGQELVAAMANFVQAGYDADEAFNLVTESAKLMIAGDMEAARSSELLVSILKGFKAPASEAAATVDLLNDVSNKYATDVEQLAVGMAALSPIAKQMGFSMAETAGLLTPIIEVYRSGSEAADALKTSLQQLSANTAPVKAALASIGVSQTDLNGKLRDGKDIFLDVARAFIGLSDAQKAYFAQELVGIEQAGRFGQTISSLGQYLKIAADDTGRAGSAMREVAARLDTADAAAKRADEAFRQLAVSLGNAFKPQIRGVVEATGELAAAFDRSIKAGDLSPLLNVIKPQIAAIENLFRAMAGNLEEALSGVDWRPLVDGLKAVSGELGEAFGKLTEGMDLTTVEGLRDLLQALINLLGNFSQFVAGAVDGLEPLLGALNTLFAAVSQNSPALANLAGGISGMATSANQIVPVVSAFGSAVFGTIGNVAELALKIGLLVAAMKLLSAAGIPVLGILGRLAGAFFALNPAVASAAAALAGFPGLVTALVAGVGTLGYGIGTLINRFVEWASGGQSVGSMLADLVDAVTGVNDEITRGATAEELAIARAKRLAAEKEKQAEATRKVAEAEEEARKKSEASVRAQEDKLKLHATEEETIRRLEAQYAAMGLVYDRVTGQILRQGEATARQLQEARELGDALDKLGVKANFMAGRITAGGQETIATFRGITQNAQATAKQIEAAFKAAISSAETEAEVKNILEAYKEWADRAKKGSADVVGATKQADDAIKKLKESTEEVSMAARMYAASGDDALEVKRKEALAAGDLATALKIEAEQRRHTANTAKEQSAEFEKQAEAVEKQAQSYTLMEDAATGAVRELAQLSAGTNALLSQMLGLRDAGKLFGSEWTGELGKLKLALNQTEGAIRHNLSIIGPYAGQFEKSANAANAVRKAYLEQAIAAESLGAELTALNDDAAANERALSDLASQAANAKKGFGLLDSERLAKLQSAIDAANDKLREMRQVTQDARDDLAELNAEIAAEKGDTDKADRLQLELDRKRAIADADAKLAEAQAANNAELVSLYEEQKRKLEELYRLKEKNLEADIKQRKNESAGTNSTNSTTTTTAPSAPSAPAGGNTTVNYHISADVSSLATEDFWRKKVLPISDKVNRLRG